MKFILIDDRKQFFSNFFPDARFFSKKSLKKSFQVINAKQTLRKLHLKRGSYGYTNLVQKLCFRPFVKIKKNN
ncbi:hypothetical protein BpHYR1_040323 [Brachionus plicatilis]|uniref:Uncharacterized protein n=1 Tax=Brachionus plicatilis TaxID=10195 RepID=A0A3M7P7M2_BRAPC|nr:hypothetical protein BpHYR1_040323 [Brachionus plicatilis]